MRLETTRIEPGIYLQTPPSTVTFEAFADGMKDLSEMVDAGGEDRYVVISDTRKVQRFPMDFKNMSDVFTGDPRLVGLIGINTPTIVGVFGKFLGRLLPQQKIYFEDSYEQALDKARRILTE